MVYGTKKELSVTITDVTSTAASGINIEGAEVFSIDARPTFSGNCHDVTLNLQKSNDESNWTTEETTTVFSGSNYWFEQIDPEYGYARVQAVVSSGGCNVPLHVVTKGGR